MKRKIEYNNITNEYYRYAEVVEGNPQMFEWMPSDTQENFLNQPSIHQDRWNALPPITYNLNSYGFRSDEFKNTGNSITFLGCSFTVGIGIRKEDTFSYNVAKKLGMDEMNLGLSGGSLDAAFRFYLMWQDIIRSQITVLVIPPGRRFEAQRDPKAPGKARFCRISVHHMRKSDRDKFLLSQVFGDDNMALNFKKNILAITQIAEKNNSKLIIVDSEDHNPEDVTTWGKARDNIHPGLLWHEHMTDNILKTIKGV